MRQINKIEFLKDERRNRFSFFLGAKTGKRDEEQIMKNARLHKSIGETEGEGGGGTLQKSKRIVNKR